MFVAVIDEFYTFDLMEIPVAKLTLILNFKVKIFCTVFYSLRR